MGKAERNRRLNAREKIAAQQAAARRAEARRRMFIAGGSILTVIAIVIVLIVVKSFGNSPSGGSGSSATAASAATTSTVLSDVSSVPASTLNSVGAGSGVAKLIATSKQPLLQSGGKPEILYIGAEYCPYCAAERWALAVALSRFGTFSNVKLIHSSGSDIYSNTATLSFYKSTYTSKYVTFVPVEWFGLKDNGVQLQKRTPEQAALMNRYDNAPYVPSSEAGSYPFIDIGNQYVDVGAQYLPSDLGSPENVDASDHSLTWTQIANDLKDPSSAVAQSIDGAANSITAAICKIAKNAPASVCNSAAVKAGSGAL